MTLAGICAALGNNAEYLVGQMSKSLKHRGPNGEGFYSEQNVALGHRAILAGDCGGNQPLSNEDDTIWITFDGQIYNQTQIENNLGEHHRFRSSSSAEVAIHAYEEDGPDCLLEFNGDFAFCLWDSKKRLLLSARDKIGVKPLYYCRRHPARFLISSEIKALLADPSLPRKPNKHVVYEYLLNGLRSHTGETFFAGVMELLPAHYMLVSDEGVEVHRYWSPRRSSQTDPQLGNVEPMWTSRFLELLQDSVRIRIPENLPIGTFLSGGADSTTVASLIDRALNSNPKSTESKSQELFSAAYPNTEADERAFAEQVARALDSRMDYTHPAAKGHWEDIERFIYHMDEPVPVLNYYIYWCLSRAASRRVKIIFSGQGPDETLGGHIEERIAYIRELWKRTAVFTLVSEVVGSLTQYGFREIITNLLSFNVASKIRRLLGSDEGGTRGRIERLFSQDFRDSAPARKTYSTLEELLLREVTETLLLDHLQFGDRASSAFSTEMRYPFLDYRVVEFIFSLPGNQKFRNGWSKYILRNAVKGIIPESIRRRRRKMGTPIPLEKWLRDLKGQIEGVFESRRFRQRGYFNQPAVLDVYRRYCNGRLTHSEKMLYGNLLWRILNLELWFEAYVDPAGESDVIEGTQL